MLMVIGYLLQWPQIPWSGLWKRPELLRASFGVGPLQLVGFCLILCETIFALFGSRAATAGEPRRARGALALLGALIAFGSPLVWKLGYSGRMFPLFGMWFDGEQGSLFPFFPWAFFFLVGVLASGAVGFAQRLPLRTSLISLAVSLAGAGAIYRSWLHGERLEGLYGQHNFWHANPMYLGFRSALVVALLGLLVGLSPALDRLRTKVPTASTLFDVLARQSLVAYVTHLLVLYGTPFTTGLVRFGRVFSLSECAGIFALVLLYTLAISYLWEHTQPATWLARFVRQQIHRVRERERFDVSPAEQDVQATPSFDHGE
jgi:hypothetical protein